MDDAFSQGRPFVLDDIWRLSSFQLEENTGSLIAAKLTNANEFEFHPGDGLHLPDLEIPDIGDIASSGDNEIAGLETSQPSPIALPSLSQSSIEEGPADIWSLDVDHDFPKQSHQLHTWETFEEKHDFTATRTAYLSEAGPEAFNAALQISKGAPATTSVLPQNVTLRALCNVVLGRSSNLFQWNSEKEVFVQALPNIPICGLSLATSSSVIARITAAGSMYRVLSSFAASTNTLSKSCTGLIAFKCCLTDILDGLEADLLSHTHGCRSILQLQRALDRPNELLTLLWMATDIVKNCENDENMISALSDFVHQHRAAGNRFASVLKLVLSRTSQPWLERLHNDVGLGGPLLTPSLESKTEPALDDSSDTSLRQMHQQTNGMPSFVSKEDQALIASTKESVKAVRQHLPDHQFNSASNLGTRSYDGAIDLSDEIPLAWQERDSLRATKAEEFTVWADQTQQQDWMSILEARMSSEPLHAGQQGQSELKSALARNLDEDELSEQSETIYDVMQLDPLETLRPAIIAHKKLLNKTLLRHVFDDLDLRQHLNLHRQYHLLGNGDFVARLTQALFSADTQTAERRRGVVPNSQAMGLRLDTRDGQRWPPASSELRLTLAGVLTGTYHSGSTSSRSAIKQELPGGLSFSIRELPDDEIDRVMNVDSIYALDFLRLQYNAPSCLALVFTPAAMKAYDDIFKCLIRVLRVVHVATKLRERLVMGAVSRQTNMRSNTTGHSSCIQFALQAHQTLSVLFTHLMDVGIESPWQVFSSSLTRIENTLQKTDGSMDGPQTGLDELRVMHDAYLDRVRSKMFLRRKGEKIRKAIDKVLISVLEGALAAEREEGGPLDAAPFETASFELCAVLEDTVQRPRRATVFIEADESDIEAMKILLMRLR